MSILIVGDSFTAPDGRYDIWPNKLGRNLNKTIYNHALPGAGYVAPGPGTPNRFSRQINWHRDHDRSEIECIVVFGSVNDWSYLGDYYRATVYTTHRDMEITYPNAKQLIVLPQWAGPNAPRPQIAQMRNMIGEAMWGYDFQYPYLDPQAGPSNTWWFPLNRPDLWGPDQFHPNQAGHDQILCKIEPHVRTLLGM